MGYHVLCVVVSLVIALSAGCSNGAGEAPVCPHAFGGNGGTHGAPHTLIGKTVPNLALDAFHKGEIKTVRLADYRGAWLVLVFYPADFTYVCPTELRELAELYGKFTALKAEVVSVSTDSMFVHRAWHEHNEAVRRVTFPMVSDRAGKLSRALGAYVEAKGAAERASFVVDPEGRIVAYEFHDETIGRSADELLRKLEAAVAVRASNGDFCPAGWRPGRDMVTPR
ncbi:MAG TPA: redoxin domain-containing protein [Spirochaetota bacterium]|nr:redoxin domain-containing protein [Spirochaetota bacterium]